MISVPTFVSADFGGGGLDLCLNHLLLIIGPGKSNQEVDFLGKTGELYTFLIFENQNRAEGFIWQEIGPNIRKVCEILVYPHDQRLHLIRKTMKDTLIGLHCVDF